MESIIFGGEILADFQPEQGFEEYLKSTEFCDSDNDVVRAKAEEITEHDKKPREKALSVFHFVRDNIKFMMGKFEKASDTLMRGHGDWNSKTNLQVALLRAVKIPARFHIASLSKDSIKGIVSDLFYQNAPDVLPFHPWCECYLDGKWISCDTLLDRPLIESAYKRRIFTKEEIPRIEWDGYDDLNTMTHWMLKDKGTFPSLDQILFETQKGQNSAELEKEQMKITLKQSNKYTESLREN